MHVVRYRSCCLGLCVLLLSMPAAAQQITVGPIFDTSIYSESADLSNGKGAFLFAGNTANGDARRALLKFDVSSIPSSAQITSASLSLHMSKTAGGGGGVTVHRLLLPWAEGQSNADANEGKGASATSGDATWTYAAHALTLWAAPGADFDPAFSSHANVAGVGTYTWTGAGLVADVQSWVLSPSGNHGWILIGNEGTTKTAKRFDSRENPAQTFRPALTVTYTTTTSVDGEAVAGAFSLGQNYPNPFSDETTVSYSLDRPGSVSLEVFDLLGRKVATLADGIHEAGTHKAVLSGSDLPPGIYLARLLAGGASSTRQLVRRP